MKVQIIDISENPIEKIFKSYRICYSKDSYSDIKIPYKETHIQNHVQACAGLTTWKSPDNEAMIDFIKDKIDLNHTSPLEHVSISFSVEGLSRAALAQITRHRTFKFNVQSQRYIDANNFDFEVPDILYISEELRSDIQKDLCNTFDLLSVKYNELIESGLKKEDARAILPQATTCNFIVTVDLHNFRNFLRQRLCKHAQLEIRNLANEMNELVKEYIPFCDYKVLLCQNGLCKDCKNSSKF